MPAALHAEGRQDMGYFRKKIRRGAVRQHVRAVHEASVESGWWEAWREAVPPVDNQRWYLRFSVSEQDRRTGRRSGVFTAAYDLLGRSDLDSLLRGRLRRTVSWFERHLPARKPGRKRAIFFFKSDAGACAERIWELVACLRDAGLHPEMVSVRRVGTIVYEDRYQVAAVPEREGRSTS